MRVLPLKPNHKRIAAYHRSLAEFEKLGVKHESAVRAAFQALEEHSGEELSLSKVAKAVNISANHLSEKFKQVTGVKFVDYIAQIRFEKAPDFLLNSNLRISEIAFEVGFQSLSQFNRVFKRLSGKSPSAYRAVRLKRKSR